MKFLTNGNSLLRIIISAQDVERTALNDDNCTVYFSNTTRWQYTLPQDNFITSHISTFHYLDILIVHNGFSSCSICFVNTACKSVQCHLTIAAMCTSRNVLITCLFRFYPISLLLYKLIVCGFVCYTCDLCFIYKFCLFFCLQMHVSFLPL